MKKNTTTMSVTEAIGEQQAKQDSLNVANSQNQQYVENLNDFQKLFGVKVIDANDVPAGENEFLDLVYNRVLDIIELEGSVYKNALIGVDEYGGVLVVPIRKGRGDGEKGKFNYSPFGKNKTALAYGDKVTPVIPVASDGVDGTYETIDRSYYKDGVEVSFVRSFWRYTKAVVSNYKLTRR